MSGAPSASADAAIQISKSTGKKSIQVRIHGQHWYIPNEKICSARPRRARARREATNTEDEANMVVVLFQRLRLRFYNAPERARVARLRRQMYINKCISVGTAARCQSDRSLSFCYCFVKITVPEWVTLPTWTGRCLRDAGCCFRSLRCNVYIWTFV
jgi:hypothetical protein